jgi:predicted branched-subunit amino acid permease
MIPWGMVTGVAMVSAGLTTTQAMATSVLVYAGSAQLSVLPLFVTKSPLWVMLVTAFMVNLRYAIYSAVLAPHFRHLSRGWRALLSYLTVDGLFALFVAKYSGRSDDPTKHWFYLGGTSVLWVAWQVASAIGIYAGALIPRDWSLEFASTLALIALTMPLLYNRAVVVGAVASGIVALIARPLPMNLGIVLAICVGVAVGVLAAPALASSKKGVA